jgi:hypothetical protein
LAHVAEGRGRFTLSSNPHQHTATGSRKSMPAISVADSMEQFADRLLQLQSPGVRAHDRTPVVTSPSTEQATLRTLARQIFEVYPTLPWYHPDKQGQDKQRLFRFLADECSPSQEKVLDAAQVFVNRCQSKETGKEGKGDDTGASPSSSNTTTTSSSSIPSIHHLQQACTPEYQSVLTHLLQQQTDEGLSFLLLLRQDLLNYIAFLQAQPLHDSNSMIQKYKQLDQYIVSLFQIWFAPGLMQVQRLTYETTSAAIVERMARKEAVHPMQSLDDLRHRLGGSCRRVFGLFHCLLPNRPLLVVYVSLEPTIPASMDTIHNHDQEQQQDASPADTRVATFYSISNLESGLKGVGLGEFLLHQAVECIQNEHDHNIQIFCTLSPLPTFRKWLEERSNATGKFAAAPQDLLDTNTTQQLAQHFQVTTDKAISAMMEYLQSVDRADFYEEYSRSGHNDHDDDESTKSSPPIIQTALLKLAAHYLVHEKHRRQPLDPVARFHIGNGAWIHAIRWQADTSRKGWNQSFGIMVNYEYELEQIVQNRANFEESFVIPMRDSVKELVE